MLYCCSGILTTAGSTNALQPPSSSNKARPNDTAAEPRRIITSWSLNCSKMSSQMGVGGSSGMASHLLLAFLSVHMDDGGVIPEYGVKAFVASRCGSMSRNTIVGDMWIDGRQDVQLRPYLIRSSSTFLLVRPSCSSTSKCESTVAMGRAKAVSMLTCLVREHRNIGDENEGTGRCTTSRTST